MEFGSGVIVSCGTWVGCYSVKDVIAKMLKKEEEEDKEKDNEEKREAEERKNMDKEHEEGCKRRLHEMFFGHLCYISWVDGKR